MTRKSLKKMTDRELSLLRWKLLAEVIENKTAKSRNRRHRIYVEDELNSRKA